MRRSLKSRSKKVEWHNAPDIKKRAFLLINSLNDKSLNTSRLFFFRSYNTNTRAIARIWAFPRVWQLALKEKPAYVIEVIAERFDSLSQQGKDNAIIHELAHIPKTFSGSLVPHIRRGKRNFYTKVKGMIDRIKLE